ncbi:TetR/AcrR family transcriptional regulator [Cellulomonas sp. McL0617]|uniref:TetR/AcrR family transcriptional regulator n=1 Tax=Cellulomonas sp. McL0617 TaxID=3415675 RepID=UPI003CF41EA5
MRAGGTREQIVEAALALVAERGFAATSVDDIAAAAGVAKGSIFYNFGSKAGLFESIISQGVGRLTAALRSASDGLHGRDALEALVGELLAQIEAHPDFAKLMAAESFRTGRSWQDSIRHLRDESIGTFADVVAETWPERNALLAAAALFGATLLAGLEWLVFQPHRTQAEVRDAVLATIA